MAEDQKERRDRELMELLQELRVAIPGVQVLFAFLLVVPFSQRWANVTDLQRNVFFAAFMCTAAATALLIAPTAYHRLRFRESDKEQMLVTSNRLSIAGTAFLAVAITLVVYLITDVLFGGSWAPIVTALVGLVFLWLWYGLPLTRRASDAGGDG
jgi:Family of unknown function (DUF6328)